MSTPGPGDVLAVQVLHKNALVDTVVAITVTQVLFYGFEALNIDAAISYLQIFDVVAGDVSLGTTTPKVSIGIPANGQKGVWLEKPVVFGTAMSMAATTDQENSTAGEIDLDVWFA